MDWRAFGDTYRIIRNEDGWYLYRNDQLVDIDRDEEQAPLADVLRWASMVVQYEDRVEVLAWKPVDAGGRHEFTAEIKPTPRL
jgi:hypothetical protein